MSWRLPAPLMIVTQPVFLMKAHVKYMASNRGPQSSTREKCNVRRVMLKNAIWRTYVSFTYVTTEAGLFVQHTLFLHRRSNNNNKKDDAKVTQQDRVVSTHQAVTPLHCDDTSSTGWISSTLSIFNSMCVHLFHHLVVWWDKT